MDLVNAIVHHLRADATFVALLAAPGGAVAAVDKLRIREALVAGDVRPNLSIEDESGDVIVNRIVNPRVRFLVRAQNRAKVAAIFQRMDDLFNGTQGYYLNDAGTAGTAKVLVVNSKASGTPNIFEGEEQDEYEGTIYFEFTVVNKDERN